MLFIIFNLLSMVKTMDYLVSMYSNPCLACSAVVGKMTAQDSTSRISDVIQVPPIREDVGGTWGGAGRRGTGCSLCGDTLW